MGDDEVLIVWDHTVMGDEISLGVMNDGDIYALLCIVVFLMSMSIYGMYKMSANVVRRYKRWNKNRRENERCGYSTV